MRPAFLFQDSKVSVEAFDAENGMTDKRKSQQQRLIDLLEAYPEGLPLPVILNMRPHIANHTARFSEMRSEGYVIRCEKRIINEGNLRETHSVYYLEDEPQKELFR